MTGAPEVWWSRWAGGPCLTTEDDTKLRMGDPRIRVRYVTSGRNGELHLSTLRAKYRRGDDSDPGPVPAPVPRISGHGLVSEGAAHEDRDGHASQVRKYAGFAVCQCGARSPVLPSGAQRKQWHREHKIEVASS